MSLFHSYDRMMIFVQKHLPDKFYMEKDQRISLRSRIFYEVVANSLIHREFTNSYPAKFIIEKDWVITENWNRPHGNGKINPDNFSPYPKNPVIAKFFHQIGRAEELGSGIRNTFKYVSQYATRTQQPEFIEEDVFKTIIPIPILDDSDSGKSSPSPIMGKRFEGLEDEIIDEVRRKFGEEFGESSEKIIILIYEDPTISAKEIAEKIGLSPRGVEKNLATLKKKGVVERIGPPRGGKWRLNV